MVGFDLNGLPICKVDSQACGAEEVMVGFDLNGTPICRSDAAACGKECFGGDNDGNTCTFEEDCLGETADGTLASRPRSRARAASTSRGTSAARSRSGT